MAFFNVEIKALEFWGIFFIILSLISFPLLICSFFLELLLLGPLILYWSYIFQGFPGGSEGRVSACNVGDLDSIPRSGRSPGEGNGNPLQYPCLENPLDRGAWYSPPGHRESDTTEWLHFTYSFLFFSFPVFFSIHFYFTFKVISLTLSFTFFCCANMYLNSDALNVF